MKDKGATINKLNESSRDSILTTHAGSKYSYGAEIRSIDYCLFSFLKKSE